INLNQFTMAPKNGSGKHMRKPKPKSQVFITKRKVNSVVQQAQPGINPSPCGKAQVSILVKLMVLLNLTSVTWGVKTKQVLVILLVKVGRKQTLFIKASKNG